MNLMIIICVLSPPVLGIIAICAKLVIAITMGNGLTGRPSRWATVSGWERSVTHRKLWPRISTACSSIE